MESTSERYKKQIEAWINEKWVGEKKCPICQKNRWNIAEEITISNTYSKKKVVEVGASRLPVFSIICSNCGHVLFFNAVLSGLVSPEKGDVGGSK